MNMRASCEFEGGQRTPGHARRIRKESAHFNAFLRWQNGRERDRASVKTTFSRCLAAIRWRRS